MINKRNRSLAARTRGFNSHYKTGAHMKCAYGEEGEEGGVRADRLAAGGGGGEGEEEEEEGGTSR